MASVLILIVSGLLMRIAGAAARAREQYPAVQVVGWLSCGVASWLMVSAAGAYTSIGWVLAAAAVAGIVQLRTPSWKLTVVADAVIVALVASLSVPRLGAVTTIALVIAVTSAGAVIDLLTARAPLKLQRVIVAGQYCCVVLFVVSAAYVVPMMPVFAWHTVSPLAILQAGVSPTMYGERVEFGTGVAWLDRSGDEAAPGALFFHGAHRDGAQQPAAQVVRRALIDAGFTVLSVDHIGFGSSALPPLHSDLDTWDPLHLSRDALDFLAEKCDGSILAVGHSMGCIDVLRLMAAGEPFDMATLFGGAINVPPLSDEHWSERFHRDRQIAHTLDGTRVTRIRAKFYDEAALASELHHDHPPIVFVRFGVEHDNVVEGRDVLYDLIPVEGRIWDFDPSTHYFNAWRRGGIVVGNAHVAGQLAREFRFIRQQLQNLSDEGM